jgi:DNA replication protein DnaC
MMDVTTQLLKAHLKQLRLPAMVAELEKLSREAAASNQSYEQFLLQLTEVELASRAGYRVRFFTAAALVSKLEQAQKQYTLDRFLGQLDRAELLICDELGYVSFSRAGVELLFRVFTDRYERSSLLITGNLAFGDWGQVFQGERMTAALLDRLTHRCHIFEMNGESYRFRESMKAKKGRKAV